MKQFLIVVLVTAAVFLGYKLLSGGEEEPQRRTRRGEGPPVVQTGPQRPRTGGGQRFRTVETQDGTTTVAVPEEFEDRQRELIEAAQFEWHDLVSDEHLVPVEDTWDFDFGAVDFDADVLAVVGGVEIERAEFERYLCLTLGKHLVESELLARHARLRAEERGETYGFTDEEWDEVFASWCRLNGIDVAAGTARMAGLYQLLPEDALDVRRNHFEAMLAYYPPVQFFDDLPPATRSPIVQPEDEAYVMQLINVISDLRADLEAEDAAFRLVNATEPLANFFSQVLPEEQFRRSWTFFDGELPPDAVAGFYVGDVVEDQLMPPWLQPGNSVWITVAEVLPKLEGLLVPEVLEKHLREFVWYEVLRARLEADEDFLAPEEGWMAFAEEYLETKDSVFNMTFAVNQAYEFPTVGHYRAAMNVYRSFGSTLPEGWDSEDAMRDFYAKNRFFIENWNPAMEIVLFTPRRLEEDSLAVDWDYAKAQAEAFRERVEAGASFSLERQKHHQQLKAKFEELLGEANAEAFEQVFSNGELGLNMNLVSRALRENRWQQMLNGTSVVRNAVVRLEKDEISPAWKTPIGYVVLKMRGAGFTQLEGVFEDYEYQTKWEYQLTRFYEWLNAVLGDAKLELPEDE